MRAGKTRLTKADTIALARSGDPGALAAIYEANGESLFRLAARILGSVEEGEDLIHDLFVGLPELLARYEHRERFEAWLRGVVVRSAIAHLRRNRRRASALEARRSIGQLLARDVWGALDLERALNTLSADDRTIIVLTLVEGYSHKEAAELMDTNEGAARVRLTRALKRLRRLLEPPA